MARRFQPLIATSANVRATISCSVKWRAVSSHRSSGTWLSATRVTASVYASAARSLGLKNGVSCQALSA